MTITGRVKPIDTNLSAIVGICGHLANHPEFGVVVRALIAMAREQDDANKHFWSEHQGEPASHAHTHRGGTDTVISTAIPLGNNLGGAAGSPRGGAPAHAHQHPSALAEPGDLLTVAAGAEARLPVGHDGRVLVADASAATGLRWGRGEDTPSVRAALSAPRPPWINVFAHQNFK